MATLRATINVNANNLTSQQSLSTQIVSNLTVTEGGVLVDNKFPCFCSSVAT